MHTFTQAVTFTPLSRGRYRCNQNGQVLTQKEILGFVHSLLKTGSAPVTTIGTGPPKKKAKTDHVSKYQNKK